MGKTKQKNQNSFPAGQLCPPPPVINHGQHDGKDMEVFIPGKSVNYSCDPGYSLVGKSTLYCTDNASWSTPHPQCEGEHTAPWWAVRGQRPSRGLDKKRPVQRGSWQRLQLHFLGMGEQTGTDLKAPNPGTACMSAPGVSKLPVAEPGGLQIQRPPCIQACFQHVLDAVLTLVALCV